MDKGDSATTSESSQDGSIVLQGQYPVKINTNALGLGQATTADGSSAASLQTITMTNAGTGGTLVQYAQSQDGQQFFVPGMPYCMTSFQYIFFISNHLNLNQLNN